jgi:hypothetical protein
MLFRAALSVVAGAGMLMLKSFAPLSIESVKEIMMGGITLLMVKKYGI